MLSGMSGIEEGESNCIIMKGGGLTEICGIMRCSGNSICGQRRILHSSMQGIRGQQAGKRASCVCGA